MCLRLFSSTPGFARGPSSGGASVLTRSQAERSSNVPLKMSFSLHGVVSFGFCPFTFIDLPPAFDRIWFWTLRRCRKKAQLEPAHSCGYRFPHSFEAYRTIVLISSAAGEACCPLLRSREGCGKGATSRAAASRSLRLSMDRGALCSGWDDCFFIISYFLSYFWAMARGTLSPSREHVPYGGETKI